MSPMEAAPLWAAIVVSVCLVTGAAMAFIGGIGMVRLKSFYQRVHAPTLGATAGLFLILLGSAIFFTVLRGRISVHEILIALFLTLTTPVGLILLVRATQHRRDGTGSPTSRNREQSRP